MHASMSFGDMRAECQSIARGYKPSCPSCNSRKGWKARMADCGVSWNDAMANTTRLYVALECKGCGAHDAATVVI